MLLLATGGLALLRRTVLKDWPPRYADRSHQQVETSVVAETEIFSFELFLATIDLSCAVRCCAHGAG